MASKSRNYYYHYTTSENAEKIWESGELQPSTDVTHDCLGGVGVYFTTLKNYPHNSKGMLFLLNSQINNHEAK